MYTNLLLFRNELKNKNMPRYKLIGIVVELLLSKEVFKRNSEIAEFVKDTFNIEFKEYILKSRTMITAKLCREIHSSNTPSSCQKKLYDFVDSKIEQIKKDGNVTTKKNEFDGWLN